MFGELIVVKSDIFWWWKIMTWIFLVVVINAAEIFENEEYGSDQTENCTLYSLCFFGRFEFS